MLAAVGHHKELLKYELNRDPIRYAILGNGPFEIHDFNGNVADEKDRFTLTLASLVRSGFTEDDIENILDVTVALLYLGNVKYDED